MDMIQLQHLTIQKPDIEKKTEGIVLSNKNVHFCGAMLYTTFRKQSREEAGSVATSVATHYVCNDLPNL